MKPSKKAAQNRREYMKLYMREWRKNNPEKVAEYFIRYWEKRANETEFDERKID